MKTVSYRDGDKIISISPYDGFKITGELAFDDNIIRTQKYTIKLNSDRFDKEISRARTFGYVEQVEELWANSLALGGTLENVIAIHWNRKSVLNEDGLRFQDEFIRHKVLNQMMSTTAKTAEGIMSPLFHYKPATALPVSP